MATTRRVKRGPALPDWHGMNWIYIGTREALYYRDGDRCVYCLRTRNMIEAAGDKMSLDHIFPRSMGGKATPDNLITACLPCNASRGLLPPLAFADQSRRKWKIDPILMATRIRDQLARPLDRAEGLRRARMLRGSTFGTRARRRERKVPF